MARMESQKGMGYYPTPETVLPLIREHLEFPEEPFNALDPCAGTGAALKGLTDGTPARTFGIELDLTRGGTCRGALERVVVGDFFSTEIAPKSFQLAFVNPPYDFDKGEDVGEDGRKTGDRTEVAFLSRASDLLVAGCVLVLLVPASALNTQMLNLLAFRFEGVDAYRFPDPEFSTFKQVVVLARSKGARQKKTALSEEIKGAQAAGGLTLPVLGQYDEGATFDPFAVPAGTPVKKFRSRFLDSHEALAASKESPAWGRMQRLTTEASDTLTGTPPLPLRKEYIVLLMAAGVLNGPVGRGADRHLVRAKPVKVSTFHPDEKDEDGESGVIKESYKPVAKAFRVSGELITIGAK